MEYNRLEPQLKTVSIAKFVDIDGNGKRYSYCDYDELKV